MTIDPIIYDGKFGKVWVEMHGGEECIRSKPKSPFVQYHLTAAVSVKLHQAKSENARLAARVAELEQTLSEMCIAADGLLTTCSIKPNPHVSYSESRFTRPMRTIAEHWLKSPEFAAMMERRRAERNAMFVENAALQQKVIDRDKT